MAANALNFKRSHSCRCERLHAGVNPTGQFALKALWEKKNLATLTVGIWTCASSVPDPTFNQMSSTCTLLTSLSLIPKPLSGPEDGAPEHTKRSLLTDLPCTSWIGDVALCAELESLNWGVTCWQLENMLGKAWGKKATTHRPVVHIVGRRRSTLCWTGKPWPGSITLVTWKYSRQGLGCGQRFWTCWTAVAWTSKALC